MTTKRSNCIIYAFKQYFKYGGYITGRKSKHGWWFHLFWSKDLKTFFSYSPIKPINFKDLPWWKRILPIHTLFFEGYIKEGDGD